MINVFSKFLLEALGFDTYWLGCDFKASSNNHILTIVRNVRAPGDSYIVDVGQGTPNFKPIPLNFEEESPLYSQSFSQYKFVRERDGRLVRYIKMNIVPTTVECEWKEYYVVKDLQPKELSYFDEVMEEIYTERDAAITPFCTSLRAVGYRREGPDDLRCVALKDSTFLLENEEHCLESTTLNSVEEVFEKVDTYFPTLSAEVRLAVGNVTFPW